METLAVIALVVVCALVVGRHMLRSLGIGTGQNGKPDCGCGRCAERAKRSR